MNSVSCGWNFMYLHRKAADWGDGGLMDQVHLVTDALYGAPADRLEGGGRAEAVAVPLVLGLVSMHGLARRCRTC